MTFHQLVQRLGSSSLAAGFALCLTVALLSAVQAQGPAPAAPGNQASLRINELMADNKSTLSDPDEPGEAPDWIEIYNPTDEAVALDGLALTDDIEAPGKFPITNGLTIPPFGYILFYADENGSQGPLHTNFKLGQGGEFIGLYRLEGLGRIDAFDFPALETDQSYGRLPNGSGDLQILQFATPNGSNGGDPPRVSGVSKPPVPAPANAPVTVTATITDIDAIVAATIVYSTTLHAVTSSSELTAPMVSLGGDIYAGQIPGQVKDTLVSYYVRAVDEDGESSRLPLTGNERRYLTGYTPPQLIINEIVYWNDTLRDPYFDEDEYPDWIEIYNPTTAAISLNGLSISDNKDEPLKFEFDAGLTVPALGRVVFLADDDMGQGLLHLNFELKAGGEYVGLYGGQGTVKIDSYDLNHQSRTGAAGRIPDGSPADDAWSDTVCPTFNRANLNCDKAQFLPLVNRQ